MSAHWVDTKHPPTSEFVEPGPEGSLYSYVKVALDPKIELVPGTEGVHRIELTQGGVSLLLFPKEVRELTARLNRFAEIAGVK